MRAVSRWLSRLRAIGVPPVGGTDETAGTPLSSALAVRPEGGAANHARADPELAAVAWTDDDIARFMARRARLLRWGWPEPEAEAMAERLTRRDREADPRVMCVECVHYRPERCANHRRAGLHGPEMGRDLAGLLQRCAGFEDRPDR